MKCHVDPIACPSLLSAAERYAGLDAAATALAALAAELQRGGGEPGSAPDSALDDGALVRLVSSLPGLLREPPAEVRSRLEALGSALGCGLVGAAALVAAVPSAWSAPPEAAAARVTALARELGVAPERAAALVRAVPPLFGLSATSIVKDRCGAGHRCQSAMGLLCVHGPCSTTELLRRRVRHSLAVGSRGHLGRWEGPLGAMWAFCEVACTWFRSGLVAAAIPSRIVSVGACVGGAQGPPSPACRPAVLPCPEFGDMGDVDIRSVLCTVSRLLHALLLLPLLPQAGHAGPAAGSGAG